MKRVPRVDGRLAAREHLDFDQEARKIFSSLKVDGSVGRGTYNPCDPIWCHPVSGGTLFVGNHRAASNIDVLDQHGITHVINCTSNMANFHAKTGKIAYFRFDVSGWWREIKGTGETARKKVLEFTTDMLNFVGSALSAGKNVLVHCAAGAHRAGTTGVILLMHFMSLDATRATMLAQKLRPIINPIGTLPQLLEKVEDTNTKYPPISRFPASHFGGLESDSSGAPSKEEVAEAIDKGFVDTNVQNQ
eukprot:CAMPEP_0181325638 /NCGR_PEP_ID=MMETSP1101-20121128/21044_1 /TAXON_ID=46948 /ORGANISM="Rhodomonas abbreviata, Strain Caron Lab Isolate" /LENGTH=246 /DNA_ID=CAMNT_0023433983 /DNA_START=20 /DNA_END=760 /DNA_ORIENTATION=-